MRPALVLLLGAAIAAGAPTGLKTWRSDTRRLDGEITRYWRDLNGRLPQIFIDYRAELEKADARPDENKEATYDYAPWRSLYEDYLQLERARGRADLALAKSDDPKALATLFDALLDLCKRIDGLEEELDKGKPKVRYFVFDPRLGIERTGLAQRLEALQEALAVCPGAAEYLSVEGWKKAEKSDGRDSVTRRVALIDVFARLDNETARLALQDQLAAPSTSLRVAAAEGLVRYGVTARPALQRSLTDPSPIVRGALLRAIRTHCATDGGWIPPVIDSWESATGNLRVETLATLELLTKQKFGHAPAEWKEWLEIYREEIAGGGFDAEKIEVQEATPAPLEGALEFYGIPCHPRGFAFVIEATKFMAMPAEWEIQRSEYRDKWPGLRAQWEENYPSHQKILTRELTATLAHLPKEIPFGIVTLSGIFVVQQEPDRGLFTPGNNATKQALRLVDKMPLRGWCSQFEGIRTAARMGGLAPEERVDFPEPRLDTVYLLGPGDPAGGRYMTPEATIAAFRRFNRFRGLTVHCIRTCNEKEASETLMKGIAEASGGTYVWMSKPPAE